MSYDDYEFLKIEIDAGVLTCTMNSPETLNAISSENWTELGRFWTEVSLDGNVRVIVVTGAGKAFCAGGNLKKFATTESVSDIARTELSPSVWRTWLSVPQPIIAAVNGDAVGFGTSLAVACDIVLSVPQARFGSPHVRLGIVPASNLGLWPTAVKLLHAKQYLLTGRLFPADEAYRIGLINQICEPEELLTEATSLAREIAGHSADAVRWTKKTLNKVRLDSWNMTYDLAQAYESMATQSPEHHEAMRKFSERQR